MCTPPPFGIEQTEKVSPGISNFSGYVWCFLLKMYLTKGGILYLQFVLHCRKREMLKSEIQYGSFLQVTLW